MMLISISDSVRGAYSLPGAGPPAEVVRKSLPRDQCNESTVAVFSRFEKDQCHGNGVEDYLHDLTQRVFYSRSTGRVISIH